MTLIESARGYLQPGLNVALGWLLSPAAWSQFALLAVAYLAARGGAGRGVPVAARC